MWHLENCLGRRMFKASTIHTLQFYVKTLYIGLIVWSENLIRSVKVNFAICIAGRKAI